MWTWTVDQDTGENGSSENFTLLLRRCDFTVNTAHAAERRIVQQLLREHDRFPVREAFEVSCRPRIDGPYERDGRRTPLHPR